MSLPITLPTASLANDSGAQLEPWLEDVEADASEKPMSPARHHGSLCFDALWSPTPSICRLATLAGQHHCYTVRLEDTNRVRVWVRKDRK
jgi:hypothetical protein